MIPVAYSFPSTTGRLTGPGRRWRSLRLALPRPGPGGVTQDAPRRRRRPRRRAGDAREGGGGRKPAREQPPSASRGGARQQREPPDCGRESAPHSFRGRTGSVCITGKHGAPGHQGGYPGSPAWTSGARAAPPARRLVPTSGHSRTGAPARTRAPHHEPTAADPEPPPRPATRAGRREHEVGADGRAAAGEANGRSRRSHTNLRSPRRGRFPASTSSVRGRGAIDGPLRRSREAAWACRATFERRRTRLAPRSLRLQRSVPDERATRQSEKEPGPPIARGGRARRSSPREAGSVSATIGVSSGPRFLYRPRHRPPGREGHRNGCVWLRRRVSRGAGSHAAAFPSDGARDGCQPLD